MRRVHKLNALTVNLCTSIKSNWYYSDIAITSTTIPGVTMLARWGAGEDGKYTQGQGEAKIEDIALDTSHGVVAIGGEAGMEMRQLSDGKVTCYLDFLQPIKQLALSQDGNRLAVNLFDNSVELWDLESNKIIRTFTPSNRVYSLEFHPNSRILGIVQKSTSDDLTTVLLYESLTSKELMRVEQAEVTNIQFGYDKQNYSFVVTGIETVDIRTLFENMLLLSSRLL